MPSLDIQLFYITKIVDTLLSDFPWISLQVSIMTSHSPMQESVVLSTLNLFLVKNTPFFRKLFSDISLHLFFFFF